MTVADADVDFKMFSKAARRAQKMSGTSARLVGQEGVEEAEQIAAVRWCEMRAEGTEPPEDHPDPAGWWIVCLAHAVEAEAARRYGRREGSVARWSATTPENVADFDLMREIVPTDDVMADPEHVALARDEARQVRAAISSLTPGYRRALLLPLGEQADDLHAMRVSAGQRSVARRKLREATGYEPDYAELTAYELVLQARRLRNRAAYLKRRASPQ